MGMVDENFEIDSTKIWVDRYLMSEFSRCYRGLPCKTKCDRCKRVWAETGTSTVSYAVGLNGKGVNICQSCVSEL